MEKALAFLWIGMLAITWIRFNDRRQSEKPWVC